MRLGSKGKEPTISAKMANMLSQQQLNIQIDWSWENAPKVENHVFH